MYPEIYKLKTTSVGFDWTFSFGANIYDFFDWMVVQTEMEQSQQNEIEDEKKQEFDIKDIAAANEPQSKRRTKLTQLIVSWLVAVTDREYILEIVPCPGVGEE
eukprot:821817_1